MDLPNVFQTVNDIEVGQDKPITENLFTKLGSNDNYLKANLDIEIGTRNAQVAAIIADINANVKGAGTQQTLATLYARLTQAYVLRQVIVNLDFVTNAVSIANLGTYVNTTDRGTLCLERLAGVGPPYTRTLLYNSGQPMTDLDIYERRIETTSANVFFKHRIFKFGLLP
jgi:hypothetical protein